MTASTSMSHHEAVTSGSASVAGAELFCHPNLVTAVRAWRELPHS
jgi:hypothetical protein